jgi:hypothetical protein
MEASGALDAVPAAESGPEPEPVADAPPARVPLAAASPPNEAQAPLPEPEPAPARPMAAEPTQTTSTLAADPGFAVALVAPAPPLRSVATPGVVRFAAVAPPPVMVSTMTVSPAAFAAPSVPAPPIIIVPAGEPRRLEPAAVDHAGSAAAASVEPEPAIMPVPVDAPRPEPAIMPVPVDAPRPEPATEPEVVATTAQPEPATEPLPSPGAFGNKTAAVAALPAGGAQARDDGASNAAPALFARPARAAVAFRQPPRPISAIPAAAPLAAPPVPAPVVHAVPAELSLSDMFRLLARVGPAPPANPAAAGPVRPAGSGAGAAAPGPAGHNAAFRS